MSTEDGTAHRPSAGSAFLATFPGRDPAYPQVKSRTPDRCQLGLQQDVCLELFTDVGKGP